jgi:hypothetical protein
LRYASGNASRPVYRPKGIVMVMLLALWMDRLDVRKNLLFTARRFDASVEE